MTHISKDFADVMAQGRQDQLIVRTRKFGTSCSLQSVLQLTDLAAVAYVGQAAKPCEYTLGSAASRPMRSMETEYALPKSGEVGHPQSSQRRGRIARERQRFVDLTSEVCRELQQPLEPWRC